MASIFISYRRADSAAATGRICDRLNARFGADQVFIDIETVPLGMDFREFVQQKVSECQICLIVIGDAWMGVDPDSGKRRIDNDNDMVRVEVEEALGRDIPVIPVLVGDAPVPSAAELPESLEMLSYRNGVEVRSDASFDGQMRRLISAIEEAVPDAPARPDKSNANPHTRTMIAIALGSVALAAAGAIVYAKFLAPPTVPVEAALSENTVPDTVVFEESGSASLDSGDAFSFEFDDVVKPDDPRADFTVHGSQEFFELDLLFFDDGSAQSGIVEVASDRYGQPEHCASYDDEDYLTGLVVVWPEQAYCVRMRDGQSLGQIRVDETSPESISLSYFYLVVEENPIAE